MNNPSLTTITEESITKKEFKAVALKSETEVAGGGGLQLAFNNFAELERFSNFMAISNFVPKHMRGKQADCLAVLLQAMRWQMDPFAVAQKTYFVNDGMGYEAQLVNAIIIARAPIKARPKLEWSGEGDNLKCKVSATFVGEDEPQVFEAEMKPITTKNSPLWKQQPKQQLGYFALRAWARLYCPDVLMGVYTKEEMENPSMNYGADNALDVTPESKSALDNIGEQIKAAATKKAPVTDIKPLPESESESEPEPEPIAAQNAEAASSTLETGIPASSENQQLTVSEWCEEIKNAPAIEGVEHKFKQAVLYFTGDTVAIQQLTLTKAERLNVLNPQAEKKGMFKRKPEGEAA